MKVYELNVTHQIDAPLDKVFDFFSKPENLSEITPAKLGFNILTPSPIKMEKGTLIDYTIKLMGIPLRWRSLITDYDPPKKFVDEQLKGPYSYWHHTHTFKAVDKGVEMNDVVREPSLDSHFTDSTKPARLYFDTKRFNDCFSIV